MVCAGRWLRIAFTTAIFWAMRIEEGRRFGPLDYGLMALFFVLVLWTIVLSLYDLSCEVAGKARAAMRTFGERLSSIAVCGAARSDFFEVMRACVC
jgi:hypothetical protein